MKLFYKFLGVMVTMFTATICLGQSQMIGMSVRAQIGDGDSCVIAGFSISEYPKEVLIVARGPSLSFSPYSMGDKTAKDVKITLHRHTSATETILIAENDDWGGDMAVIQAMKKNMLKQLEHNSLDSAMLVRLEPGFYSVVMKATDSGHIGLLEIYDNERSSGKLTAMSGRVNVDGTGDNVAIMGVVFDGKGTESIIFRAGGKDHLEHLGVAGTMADPKVRVHAMSNGTVIGENNNWEDAGEKLAQAITATGMTPYKQGGKDCGFYLDKIIVNGPTAFTAVVSPETGQGGVILLEMYEAPSL